jgi:hypothetical protein
MSLENYRDHPTSTSINLDSSSASRKEKFLRYIFITASTAHSFLEDIDIIHYFLVSVMLSKVNIPRLFLLTTTIANTFAMSTTRYNIPIPESLTILETRQELNDMAEKYSLGSLAGRNGGYYLLDHDATVLAIASDSLCEELDASIQEAIRYHETHPET